jgi:phosphate uptake regulator
MKRKIIKQGAGYTITLPIDWIRKYGLDSGDEIDMNHRGASIVIGNDKSKQIENASLILNGNKNQIINQIVAAYRKGTDEVMINFDRTDVVDRNGNTHKTNKIVQDIVNELIGFSVVEQKPNYFLIKNISKTDKDSFDIILRRAFLLLMNLSEESMKAIQKKDKKNLEEVPFIYHNIRQLVNYALRLLNKHEYHDHSKTANMYASVNNIDEIANALRHIAKHYSQPNIKISNESIILCQETHSLLRLMYELFYELKDEKLEKYFELRDKIYIDYMKGKNSKKFDGILENIGYIRVMATNLVRERMGM